MSALGLYELAIIGVSFVAAGMVLFGLMSGRRRPCDCPTCELLRREGL